MNNVRITWRGLYVDKERALDSKIVGSIEKEIPSGQTKWTGVALVVGVRCPHGGSTKDCIGAFKNVAQGYASYLKEKGYLTVELYDGGATFRRVTNLTRIFSIITTEKKQFVFPFAGHGTLYKDTRQAYLEVAGHPRGFDARHLSNSLRYIKQDITFVFILQACQSGNFTKYFDNRNKYSTNINKYILLSCGNDTEFCAVRNIPYLYKSFAHSILSEIKKGNSIKNAFEHAKRESLCYYQLGRKILPCIGSWCTCPTPQAMRKNVNWNNFFIRR